jgi:ribonuclease HI
VLPAWKTTPSAVLLREAGLPSATVALEEAKLRFATHLQTTDIGHPLTHRMQLESIGRGRRASEQQMPKSKVQRLGRTLPAVLRPTLTAPHYSKDCRTDPTEGQAKKQAAAQFNTWWANLPRSDIAVFSDGSEQRINGDRHVTYGYAIYWNRLKVAEGRGSLNPQSHVFDAEAVGAWRGLQHAIRLSPSIACPRIWMCIDSTSVIWCLRGNASTSSQWAFLQCQGAMEVFDIQIRWSPGHTGIVGNEEADCLADLEAKSPSIPMGHAGYPTASGIRSVAKRLLNSARQDWWDARKTNLSTWYNQWNLPYITTKTPQELELPRPTLARLLAIRSKHGDFAWYHKKFKHDDALLQCSCGRTKTPEHIVRCRKMAASFNKWPLRPISPPSTPKEGLEYLALLLSQPRDFEALLRLTNFYSKICTR